jgi:hypothetical protein
MLRFVEYYKLKLRKWKLKKEEKDLFFKFKNDFNTFRKLDIETNRRFILDKNDKMPCLHDRTNSTFYDRHYILHPAWAARVLKETNPLEHFDISSTLHFCSIISAFVKVNYFDFRPADIKLSNLKSEHADLTSLPFKDNSISSLSCMHTIEHIGLGRYGDPLDYNGDLRAINELVRVLAVNGNLLIVVPIASVPKICFNAHRIYSVNQILKYFEGLFLNQICLIPDSKDDGDLVENPSLELLGKQIYSCGCFWFKKIQNK